MKVWEVATALAFGFIFGPGASAAASPGRVVEAFHIGCLEQMPDFRGSASAFRNLGFVPGSRHLELDTPKGKILVTVMRPQSDGTAGCLVIAQLPPDAGISSLVANAITEITGGQFIREDAVVDGVSNSSFTWRSGEVEAAVALSPGERGASVLAILTGKTAQ